MSAERAADLTPSAGPDEPARPRRPALSRTLRLAWLLAVAIALGLVLRDRWYEVRASLADLDGVLLATSCILALSGVGASAGIWHAMVTGLGQRLPTQVSARIFFVGQAGKYLPGAIWPALAQTALAREHDVPARATVTAVMLFVWVHFVTGVAVGSLLLPLAGRLPVVLLAGVPVAAILLAPRVLRAVLGVLLRLVRRAPLRQYPAGRHVAAAVAAAILMWVCYGAHVALLGAALGVAVDIEIATGSFAAAWAAGFALLIAPAGVGAREAVLVWLLPAAGGAALTIALISRLVLTAADAGWSAAALLFRSRRPQS